jgi:hypothetical protein
LHGRLLLAEFVENSAQQVFPQGPELRGSTMRMLEQRRIGGMIGSRAEEY